MKQDQAFEVIKDIPLSGGKKIAKGTSITRSHGNYYMEGGLLPQDFQEDFDTLIDNEAQNGWKYITPIRNTRAFGNSKEEV